MCGVWGLWSKKPVSLDVVLNSITTIEHRGQDGYGSYINFGSYFRIEKKTEPLTLPNLEGVKSIIVNYRYATVGANNLNNFPPVIYAGFENITKINVSANDMLLTFLNGEFSVAEWRDYLLNKGFKIKATNDTAVIAGLIQHNLLNGSDLFNAVINSLRKISGAYVIMLTRNDETVISCDPFGIRRAYLYISDNLNQICISSEPQSFFHLDPFYHQKQMKNHPYSPGFRPLIPGETFMIKGGVIVEARLLKQGDLLWLD